MILTTRSSRLPERNPATHRAHRRQLLWQIIVPLAIGTVALITLAVLVVLSGPAGASVWADISLVFLLIPLMFVSLLFLAIFAASVYGLARLYLLLPARARQLQIFVSRVGLQVRILSDAVVEPILRIHSLKAGLQSLRRK